MSIQRRIRRWLAPRLFAPLVLAGAPAALSPAAATQAAFPVERNQLVATFCPNLPSGNAVILIDPPIGAPLGANWQLAPFFSNETGLPAERWTQTNLGCVFGIAVDPSPAIFVAASSSYTNLGVGTFGPGGGGGVYRLDGCTGDIDPWMVTGTGAVGTNTLPNPAPPGVTPPGLGDICYDDVSQQFFVSDFADGRIYRVKNIGNQGIVQSVHDPFLPFPYAGSPLFAPLGERVWALHVTRIQRWQRGSGPAMRRVLLFSVWLRDQTRTSTAWPAAWPPQPLGFGPFGVNNALFAWELDPQGVPVASGPTLYSVLSHLVTTSGTDLGYSNPVADITSDAGRIYTAERVMPADYGTLGIGHRARLMSFEIKPKVVLLTTFPNPFAPPPLRYRVGDSILAVDYPTGWNSCGGVTLANYNSLAHHPVVWGSGDALLGYGPGNYVYGLQGIPWGGNDTASPPSSTTCIIDLDHDITAADKTRPGDVEVIRWRCP